jgi:hypothetical protein
MLSGKQRAAHGRWRLPGHHCPCGEGRRYGQCGIPDVGCLEARELVKGRVLESAGLTAREACDMLAERCRAEPVQVIGSRFVLYRKKPDAAKSPKTPRRESRNQSPRPP